MNHVAYAPLDIPDFMDVYPGFDLAEFAVWREEAAAECEEVYRKLYPANLSGSIDTGKQRYSTALAAFDADYPWYRVQGKMAENGQYVAGFGRRFPEIIDYITKYLPFDELQCVTFLNSRDAHPVFAHFDRESGEYGYRVYMHNEDPDGQPALYFLKPDRPLRPYPANKLEFVEQDGVLLPKAWEDSFDLPLKRHYAYPKSKTQSWILSAKTFPHAADRTHANARLVMLPFGPINAARQADLINRSLVKYKDYVIF
jgi:hypothetical protein